MVLLCNNILLLEFLTQTKHRNHSLIYPRFSYNIKSTHSNTINWGTTNSCENVIALIEYILGTTSGYRKRSIV